MDIKRTFGTVITALLCICSPIKAQKNMELTARHQSLSAIAGLEAKGDLERLYTTIDEGLNRGLTVAEIKEALSQLYAYTGFPRSLNALGQLQKVVTDRKAKGISTELGNDGDILPKDFNSLQEGTKIQTQLTGKPFSYDFSKREDYYLKAHLFGDIFASPVLSHADREVVTLSAIASLKGCESQLRAHVRGAYNMGVSLEELRSIPDILATYVGDMEAYRARKAIAAVMNEPFSEGAPIENPLYPVGTPNTAYAKYFIGNSYLQRIGEGEIPMANVTFEPKCRNNWHIHHKTGQILIAVGGRGWYQEWGKEPVEMKPGTVIEIPAEVKHWHGAAKDSWFQHIAFSIPVEGASTEWLEEVDDTYYNKLP
ncbi:alkylhydroperoxidase AhpD family core domain protein [Hoylesella oralis ATCC 33269]|uniref:Alkylhydroperoxidase AhpD family core domain protein n=2 Tax=Hoylesella oralis TaxID=28134 RepID=E7RM77_9BACT|nr:alkylhydroperoxidase AhpD family core domain protein [Hoylesella oralis ATCC 33269]EPH17024.1 hypothetical protein HMPREF1475_01350 [Hoylesella oralis HGA0225]SHF44443.1 Cupin domain protein [Hoylesella oralis]